MRTLARWCFRRRWIVLIGWLVGLFVLGGLANGIGDNYKDEFKLSGTDSFDAINLLQKSAPKASGDQEQIVVAVKDGKLTDAQTKARVEQMLDKVEALPHVESVDSPFAQGAEGQISKSGRIAFAERHDGRRRRRPADVGGRQARRHRRRTSPTTGSRSSSAARRSRTRASRRRAGAAPTSASSRRSSCC